MACETEFLKRLHEAGLRLTPQRELVLRALHDIEGLATAEEIHHLVQASASAVDISTVYRTLDLLSQFGFVAVLEGEDGQRRYDCWRINGRNLPSGVQRCGVWRGCRWMRRDPFRGLQEMQVFTAPEKLTIAGLCCACRRRWKDGRQVDGSRR